MKKIIIIFGGLVLIIAVILFVFSKRETGVTIQGTSPDDSLKQYIEGDRPIMQGKTEKPKNKEPQVYDANNMPDYIED